MNTYNCDHPITDEKEDCFERIDFAKQIAGICGDGSEHTRVIGLYGKWGDGKTSLINMIAAQLPRENIIQLQFNPWLFKDEEQLVKEFFKNLADALDVKIESRKEKITREWIDYEKAIGVYEKIPTKYGIQAIAKGIGNYFSKKYPAVSLSESRRRINQFIGDKGKNIVVFIDDIDRLETREVEIVFKLVKLLADFPGMTYILCFDPDLVAKMLSPRYGGISPDSGYHFLEKIVQIPLQLPKVNPASMRRYLTEAVNKVILKHEISVAGDKRFEQVFTDGLMALLNSPRKINLFSNNLEFSIGLLKGNVNYSDLFIVELIKTCVPEYYNFIRNDKYLFVNDYLDKNNDNKKEVQSKMDNFISAFPDQVKKALRILTCLLFPRFAWVNPADAGGGKPEDWLVEKRVVSHDYFERYFTYALQKGQIPDIHFDELYLHAGDKSVNEIVQLIIDDFNAYSIDDIAFKLVYHRNRIKDGNAVNLTFALSKVSDRFKNKEGFDLGSHFNFFAMTIEEMVKGLDPSAAFDTAQKAVGMATSLNFASELVARFVIPESIKNNRTLFAAYNADQIKKTYVTRVRELMNQTGFFEAIPEENMLRLLVWWHEADSESLRPVIDQILQSDTQVALQLLKVFTPTVYTIKSTDDKAPKKFKADFDQASYERLDNIVGCKKIYDELVVDFGDKSGNPILDHLELREPLDDDILIGLFQKLYKQNNP